MFAEWVQRNASSLESKWVTVYWQQVFYWRPSNHRARLWSVRQSWSQSISERSVPTISSSSWVLFKALFNHLPELSITTRIHFARIPKQPTFLRSYSKRTFTGTGQSSHNILHQFLYCKCTVGRNCIKCNIAQYKSIALSQSIMMHLCYATRIRYAGTVLQLNKILWSDQLIITFKYMTYSYQNALQVWRFLGYQLNTVFGTVVNMLKTFDLWINTNTF